MLSASKCGLSLAKSGFWISFPFSLSARSFCTTAVLIIFPSSVSNHFDKEGRLVTQLLLCRHAGSCGDKLLLSGAVVLLLVFVDRPGTTAHDDVQLGRQEAIGERGPRCLDRPPVVEFKAEDR